MVGMMPSLLTSLLGHSSFGKSFHQNLPSSQSGAGRDFLPLFPSFFPSPRGAASLMGKHLVTTGPHLPGVGAAVSKALWYQGSFWPPSLPTFASPKHRLYARFSVHRWENQAPLPVGPDPHGLLLRLKVGNTQSSPFQKVLYQKS